MFLDATSYFARCEAPRPGINPRNGQPFPDIQGSVTDENNFLRSYSDETYLWYSEITDRDPALFADPLNYFDLLRTTATTASGALKDRFHFTYDSAEWLQLSQGGIAAGYGVQFAIVSATPPREVVIAYTEPNSPATDPAVNLARGAVVLAIDGVDVNASNATEIDVINAGLFPVTAGETHSFEIRDRGASVSRIVSVTSASIASTPVQHVKVIATPTGAVGYLLFNDHVATAEQALIDAVNNLRNGSGIDDLILDVRYNGGGFLAIASELAFMIAGPGRTGGRTFELLQFNDKHPSTNPVTGQSLAPTPFYSQTLGTPFNGGAAGQPLPTLDLPRVFVLTGAGTCSASESIINSLRGIGIQVIQIGATTCGKPYGFYPTDNCGTTYFTIQFRGVNDADFGDYTDGFSAANTPPGQAGTMLPGCSVGDDFTRPLGDIAESRLAAALAYRDGAACPAASGFSPGGLNKLRRPLDATEGYVPKSPWQTNRIMLR